MTNSLLLLHGFTGSPQSFDFVRDALAAQPSAAPASTSPASAEPTPCMPALLGHTPPGDPAPRGHTPFETRPVEDARKTENEAIPVNAFEREVDRIAQQARPFGHRVVVGYSLGARIALGLLIRHPSLARSAILIGCNPGLNTEAERRARLESDERWARVLEERGVEAFATAWQDLPLFATQRALDPRRLAHQARVRQRHDAQGLATSLRALGLGAMPNYWPELPRIAVPVTLLVGEKDTKFLGIAHEMRAALPRARLVVVPGCGHNLILEAPEACARAIHDHLRSGSDVDSRCANPASNVNIR